MDSEALNPLVTRSLPGALWEKVPRSIADFDESLRAWFASHIDGSLSPWKEIRWLTESDTGVALGIVVFALIFIYIKFKNKSKNISIQNYLKQQIQVVVFFVLLAGVSNMLSVLIKRVVGRIKPHVTWWDKAAPIPALSFPSSHAFNTAFLLLLIWLLLSNESKKKWKNYFFAFSLFTFLIGVSRIIFTQHYPLDVLAGWFMGSMFALFLSKVTGNFKNLRFLKD